MTTPVHKLRISNITAVIWRNLGDRGSWYSVQLTRGYKTDDCWRNSDYLGVNDLLAAAKLLDQAHMWIGHQLAADAAGRKQADGVTAK
jgi:hypothetical protein